MKKFKKIYIEITNFCNLHCFFCPKENRDTREMSLEEFEKIVQKIDGYTDYLYLHVKGEPLLHSKFSDILKLTLRYQKKVNITTNGLLLKEKKEAILENKEVIRQINISLHHFHHELDSLLEIIDEILLKSDIIICLRLWNGENASNQKIMDTLKERYHYERKQNKIKENLFLDQEKSFIWPNLNNSYYSKEGTCYALKTHIAILVDGRVVPCCLDQEGILTLGNIFEEELEEILQSPKAVKMKEGFSQNKKCEELCQRCNFLE